MKKFLQFSWVIALLLTAVAFDACKKEDDVAEVISGFTFKADAADFTKVAFTNASQNYKSVSWDFGDNTAASTEVNPVHTFPGAGNYTVKLTATGTDGSTDVSSQVVGIVDPNAYLTALAGTTSKSWKLLRQVNANTWPLEVGPIAKDQVWWAQGRDNDEIANRPCIMNDEFIFSRDGAYEYKTNGDYWAEGGVFEPANICTASTPDNMKGAGGIDLSAFGDGVHTFILTPGAKPTLEVVGLGAFVGLPKIGTDFEVKVPQTSVKLDIIKLSDAGPVDTLVLESDYKWAASDTEDKAYWKITLVHYDNAADEPAIPSPKPKTDFTGALTDRTIVFTNTTIGADSYAWDFGDGASSTEANPTHTYAADGVYKVRLTATNTAGSTFKEQDFTIVTAVPIPLTESLLVGGAWKIRNSANSIFVGPGLGNNTWWKVPANFLDGSTTGTDDWSCMTDDEFIFTAGGTYEYKTNGSARNDSYMGSPNGCWDDAQIAASGNGAAFGSAVHSFVLTPESGGNRAILTVKNGSFGAAFVGFYKGYYGGENKLNSDAPNGGASENRYEVMSYYNSGGVETLTLSVDVSTAKDGSSAWTMVLVR